MSKKKSQVDKTLANREKLYGGFIHNAATAQELKSCIRNNTVGWQNLAADQREALEIIMSKISRIIHGDPDYADSWHDIAGYALLVERRLLEEQDDGE